jgi:hypothetical protein
MWSRFLAWVDLWPATAWTALWGFVGVVVGAGLTAVLTSRRERQKRRLEFIEKQLDEFYSPMLGLRSEIAAHSTLRVQLQNEAGVVWRELTAAVAPGAAAQELTAARWPQFQALIEYDNDKLRKTLMPAYRKMLDVFRDKGWLAEASSRMHYVELLKFVDIWGRSLAGSLPAEVLLRLGHTEAKLQPFYDEIQAQHDRLRALVANS